MCFYAFALDVADLVSIYTEVGTTNTIGSDRKKP